MMTEIPTSNLRVVVEATNLAALPRDRCLQVYPPAGTSSARTARMGTGLWAFRGRRSRVDGASTARMHRVVS